jgi:PAS domain S-box-containing protein
MNKQPKILVVDDDPAILSATRRVLEQAGYETHSAQDGQEALELTRAQRPDLLLLDVNMPKMDGFEVCRRIKADPALTGTFIIIMSSARNDSDSQVDGLNMGADGYIARPVANRELLARVQAMLRIQAGERALQASNAQWSATFDAVSDAILLTDANYTILKCNQAAAEMWQTPPEALVGKKCYQVVHGAEAPVSACLLALVCETKSRQTLTFTQNERWLEVKVDPIFDASGNFTGTVHVIADITERKQAEEALRALSARQEAILSAVPDILMEVDQNKIYTWANSAGLAFFGDEVVGKDAAFYFEGEQDTYGIVKPLFNGSEDVIYVESWQRRKDGAKRLLAWWCRVLKDACGNTVGALSSAHDITERKQAEEALKESEERFATIFRANPAAIAITQLDGGRLVDVNKAWQDLTGYLFAEAVDHTPLELNLWVNPEQRERLVEMLRVQAKARGEMLLRRKSGEVRDLLMSAELIELTGKRYLLTMAQDITERKQAEEALRESEDKFKYVFDHSATGKSLTLVSGELNVNRAFCEMLGYSQPELQNRKWQEISHPDDVELTQNEINTLLSGKKESAHFIKRYIHKNGSTVWAEVGTALRRDKDGKALYFMTSANDITERKRAEDALRESEKRYRRITEGLTDYQYSVRVENGIPVETTQSPTCEIVTGYTADEFAADPYLWFRMIAPEDYEVVRERTQQILSGIEIPPIEHRICRKDGEMRWVSDTIILFKDASGKLLSYDGVIKDITERKQAGDALRESEEKYRRLFENTSFGIFQSTPEGKVISVNLAFARMFGYDSPADAMNSIKNVATDVFADPNRRAEIIRLMAENPGLRTFENTYRRKDGSTFTGTLNSMPVMDANGGLIRMEGIIEDITERKQAEEELRQSEELLRVILANILDPVFITDNDGKFTFICPNVINALGYPMEKIQMMGNISELIGSGFFNPEELEARGEITNIERIIVDNYGKQRVFLAAVKQVSIGEGTRLYALHDITERKRTEEELRESKLLLHLLIESLPQNIYAKDVDGRFVFANQRYCATQGKALEKIVGKTDFELHPPELAEKYRADDRQVMETDKAIDVEEEHQPLNGEKSFVQVIKTPFYDAKGQTAGTLGIFWDITERKQIEETLKEYNTHLEAAVEVRTHELRETQEKLVRQEKLAVLGQLAGGVGHELRNPLGVINNAIYYLRMVQPDANAKIKQYLGIIDQEAHNADKIISDLLDFSRIKSVDVEPVVVADLVRRTLERYPASENVRVTLDLPKDLPLVYVDPRQITQVLGNLVVNACQAMLKGGELLVLSRVEGTVSSEQRTGSREQGVESREQKVENRDQAVKTDPLIPNNPSSALRTGWLLISVKDTGSGITPENMSKLFEPLFTTKPKGIGLGLAVSKKLVEANGGRIEVQSEPGKGSTFTVFLPVKR